MSDDSSSGEINESESERTGPHESGFDARFDHALGVFARLFLRGPRGIAFVGVVMALFVYATMRDVGLAVSMGVFFAVFVTAGEYTGRQWQKALGHFQVYIPVAAFIVASIVAGDAEAAPVFFQVSSQVIVVLILALALQARALNLRHRQKQETLMIVFTIFILSAGEFDSLTALYAPAQRSATMAVATIAAGLAGVLVASLAEAREGDTGDK